MAKPQFLITSDRSREIIVVLIGLGIHLWYLFHTTFVDWPEMILYPWFLSKGLLYYRDIVLAYVPGAYYLLFVLYKLFGFTVSSERIIAYGLILLTDVLVYCLSSTLTRNKWISGISLAFFIFWQPILSGNTIWYETILAPIYLGTLFFVLWYLNKPTIHKALYIGLMLALASLIKQTAVWSIALVCLFIWLSNRKKIVGFHQALMIGVIPLVANLLVWAYFAVLGAGNEFGYWAYGFLFQLSHASSDYMLPPSRGDIILIIPAFIPIIIVMLLSRKSRIILLVCFWVIALIMAGLPRWGLHRLQPALAFSSIGVALFIKEIIRQDIKRIFISFCLICFMAVGSWRSFRLFITVRDHMQPKFFTTTYDRLLKIIQAHQGKSFYILGNFDYLYFGMDRRPSVLPWVPLFPWNAQVPGMQERLIASLEKQKVQNIFYMPFHGNKGYYLDYVPNTLLLYILSKYEKISALPVEAGWLFVRK